MEMTKEEQKEIILKKLEENYRFGCITDFISMSEFLDNSLTLNENVLRLKKYISEELFSKSGNEVAHRVLKGKLNALFEDIHSGEFEEKMTDIDKE